jgi:hypothetical protein
LIRARPLAARSLANAKAARRKSSTRRELIAPEMQKADVKASAFSCSGFGIFGGFEIEPPHPSPLPQGGEGKGSQIGGCSDPEFDWIFQVGVAGTSNPVSPLSRRERARVRGFSALHDLRQQLIGTHAISMFIEITGKNQLIRLGLLNQHLQLRADLLRTPHHRQPKEIPHRLTLMR